MPRFRKERALGGSCSPSRRCWFTGTNWNDCGPFWATSTISRRLLQSRSQNIYRTLAFLHRSPSAAVYLTDLREQNGPAAVFRELNDGTAIWQYIAADYAAMSDYAKKEERRRWKGRNKDGNGPYGPERGNGGLFSVRTPPLVRNPDELPPDCVLEGIRFQRLDNSNEYRRAGKELRNCLDCWENFGGTVYGILLNGHFAAAAELDGKRILQAYGYRNRSVETDQRVYGANCAWKERYGLTESGEAGSE